MLDSTYDNLPGVDYYQVETDQGTFRFAQGFTGVLPDLLKDLAAFRKASKKKMAEAKARGDSFAAALFNGQQLAFKVGAYILAKRAPLLVFSEAFALFLWKSSDVLVVLQTEHVFSQTWLS